MRKKILGVIVIIALVFAILEHYFLSSLLIGATAYFLPTIIAIGNNGVNSKLSFFILNLFFSWTGFGWIISFAWSLKKEKINQHT